MPKYQEGSQRESEWYWYIQCGCHEVVKAVSELAANADNDRYRMDAEGKADTDDDEGTNNSQTKVLLEQRDGWNLKKMAANEVLLLSSS